jgi:preprotein translocase subunit SecA
MGIPVVSSLGKKIFGSRNERLVKRYLRLVEEVSEYEPAILQLTDAQLRERTETFRDAISDGATPLSLLPEVFAVAREAMDRAVGIRNIFNPVHGFDPSQLPSEARAIFDGVQTEIDGLEARQQIDDLLGFSEPVPPWVWVDIPVALYEAVRELYPMSKPPFRARPFDVQIVGAIVLYEGRIAEMKTGEGKTIVAPLASYLAALEGHQVHVVTVNDYLVQRDRDWTAPFFRLLGMRVGAIHPQYMQSPQLKQIAYNCEVVYGTTAEFGFDYLRDNMKHSAAEQVQKNRNMAIVDEVDSTLIDEARTPLIISGPAHEESPRYELADTMSRHLMKMQRDWDAADQNVQSCLVDISSLEGDIRTAREKATVPAMKERMDAAKERLPDLEAARDSVIQYYEVELDKKKVTLTHEGIAEAQRQANLGSFYVGENVDLPHLLEQAIRSHVVYHRDQDYIVAPDDSGDLTIVIVDQNTGRKMVGRQWSDGLHQAIEAKEGVPIKQETQTMATVTIQNFFKLYDKLAGMTGTADTEATEFYEIYNLDVVVIPTNVPVRRIDHEDVVFLSVKDKKDAIIEEIKAFHDVGRPILVGTTSVENSKELSDMLRARYGIRHEVLNAEQHEREADIVAHAGELGAVMIATNMAGRGTDIKLSPVEASTLIDHWKERDICPRDVTTEMDDEEIVTKVYRHVAQRELGVAVGEVAEMDEAILRLALLRHWHDTYCWGSKGKSESMSEKALMKALDDQGGCLLHDLRRFENTEDLGGLHVIATERHESRRVDNQLRGRSGRQGDKGSSRSFLSLEDDLMNKFAGPTTLKVLSRLGMKEGDAIEHPMLTKAVGRAQRKVEERNFLVRKNILEYDEVMDLHRHDFYAMRQDVLEGYGIREFIFRFISDAAEDACFRFLSPTYAAECMVEWIREHLGVSIDPERIKAKDRVDLHRLVINDAKEETGSVIAVTLGEYIPTEIDLGSGPRVKGDSNTDHWDYEGLVKWFNGHFASDLKIADITSLDESALIAELERRAAAHIDSTSIDPLDPFLVPEYGPRELCRWVKNKFATELDPADFTELDSPSDAVERVMECAEQAYCHRELVYPIDFAMDMTAAMMKQDRDRALTQFCAWCKGKYELEWTPTTLPAYEPAALKDLLIKEAKTWDDDRIAARAALAVAGANGTVKGLAEWFQENLRLGMTSVNMELAEIDLEDGAEQTIRDFLRMEIAQFERWILLQILDTAWKEHLHAMDQVRESIGYRSFSQRDPRIEYKREGARLFEEMEEMIRDKVTDLIFKAQLRPQIGPREDEQQGGAGQSPGQQAQSQPTAQPPDAAQSAVAAAAAAASGQGTAEQRDTVRGAQRAPSKGDRPKNAPARSAVTVGRNEPCPCGSGKKYKKCCGSR